MFVIFNVEEMFSIEVATVFLSSVQNFIRPAPVFIHSYQTGSLMEAPCGTFWKHVILTKFHILLNMLPHNFKMLYKVGLVSLLPPNKINQRHGATSFLRS
jgi:hypothetical protein